MPKGNSKPKVNAPGSPINGAPIIYKKPPIPKVLGKQQRWTPETGVVDKLKKNKTGDLVKPANPRAISIPALGIEMREVDGDKFTDNYRLEDGSTLVLPKKKRTY